MKRLLIVATMGVIGSLHGSANAQTLLVAESWEAATAPASWYCSAATDMYTQTECNAAGNGTLAIRDSATDPAPTCAGKYIREEVQRSGGRVFLKTPIPITAGLSYCITTWMRLGLSERYPFLGINYANAAGVPVPPGVAPGTSTAPTSERWLIGDPAFGGGISGLTAAPGTWQFLARTLVAAPIAGQTHITVKMETFCGNPGCTGTGGDGDFDDIRVYTGACPAMPAPQSTESSHAACTAPTPPCTSRTEMVLGNNTAVFGCSACATGFGGATAPNCPMGNPICVTSGANSGACQTTCDADNGVTTGTAPCPTATNPVCKAGTCGTCTSNNDCTTGTNHSGALCIGGRCTTPCTIPTEGTACLAGQYCNAATAMGAGVCAPKIPNGEGIPADAPLNGTCNVANATRVCLSGQCEMSDNKCGFLPGTTCAADAVCRSGDCFTDNKCARPNGEMCATNGDCRSNICAADKLCGKPNPEACTAATECRSNICDTNGLCGKLNGKDCATDGECQAGVCDASDKKCGRIEGEMCATTLECRGASCDNNLCGSVPNGSSSSSSGGSPGSPGTAGTAANGVSIEGGGVACSLESRERNNGTGFLVIAGSVFAAMAIGGRRKRR